jgi:Domain of unknown function (DUF4398)
MFPRRRWAVLALASLLVSCASAPLQTLSDARQTIAAAEAAGAATRSPAALGVARSALHHAETLLREGRYRAAHDEAVVAQRHATEALEQAQAPR